MTGFKFFGDPQFIFLNMKIPDSGFNSVSNDEILDQSKLKVTADDTIKVTQSANLFWLKLKTLWEKEQMLVTSIFSFS